MSITFALSSRLRRQPDDPRRPNTLTYDANGNMTSDGVNSYPIQQGMAEVVAYLMIAAHAPQHRIERTIVDQIIITAPDSDQTRTVNVPRIIFARETQPEADLAR